MGREDAHFRRGRAQRASGWAKWSVIVVIVVFGVAVVSVFGYWRYGSNGAAGVGDEAGLFTARRDDLVVSVTESGDIKAVDSTDVKCDVEGRPTIVKIVPEGTYISQEDVDNGKVLVELASSELTEQWAQREIDLASAEASYAEAKEANAIQVNQNESNITAADLKMKFAVMDLQKYLGEILAGSLVGPQDPNFDSSAAIASLLDDPNGLGGEAKQKTRELTSAITLSESNLQNAMYKLEWTEKLHGRQYVAQTELQRDRLDKQRLEIEKEKAEIARDLFMQYEFPKQTEQLLSDCQEAKRELERTRAKARSELAQTEAKLASSQATLGLQQRRLAKLKKQLEACVIKAPAVGQVVYWSSTERWSRVKIEQGAQIWEGSKIVTIPDTSKMKAVINVHETWVDKIEPGQKAKITVAAFPDKPFSGEVLKKAPLADQENWMNPDLKVYATDVSIDGADDALKVGMTAKVEVVVQELKDVLYVPIQSVVALEDKKVCYVHAGSPPEQRAVETGLFNDSFVEIKSGLQEGEQVLLNPPRWTSESSEE